MLLTGVIQEICPIAVVILGFVGFFFSFGATVCDVKPFFFSFFPVGSYADRHSE